MSSPPVRYLTAAAAAAVACLARAAHPQHPPRDTLRLAELQAAAIGTDPRQRQLTLQRAIAERRLQNVDVERLPSVSVEGMAAYQSVVTMIPIQLPPPSPRVPTPPHDTYDARVIAQQRLYDPSLAPRRDVERAQLAEAEARIRTTVYGIHTEVNDAFFSAALMQARAAELTAVIADLEAQLKVAHARVREGTALRSESALLEAELLRRRQDQDELMSNRRAALTVLATLTGRTVDIGDTLVLPDLGAAVASARGRESRVRPEYEQFARTRVRLAVEARVVASQTKPRLSAFARAGYGKPGLDFLQTSFEPYWVAGVQVQWTPWNWHATARDREALRLQEDVVMSDEEAFAAANRRAVQRLLADVARLEVSLRTDDDIIVLRERIERETRRRFDEAVVTAAEYIDRRNDVLAARLARATHDVELAQARARYLTVIGLELR